MVSKSDYKSLLKGYLARYPSAVNGATKSYPKERKTAKPSAIGVREEGWVGTGVDSGRGRIYSMYKTLCSVADKAPGGGEVYVCARDGMHVSTF